jgi:hypothetical protein
VKGIWSRKTDLKFIKLVRAKRSKKNAAYQHGKPLPADMGTAKRLGMNLSAKKVWPRR